jgi:hypothetical protein
MLHCPSTTIGRSLVDGETQHENYPEACRRQRGLETGRTTVPRPLKPLPPEPVYEALRKIAFEERIKIHGVVLEGIDLALGRRGYPSIESLRAAKRR